MSSSSIEISEALDSQPLTRFAILVVVISFVLMTADGFDSATVSLVAPAVLRDWHLPKTAMGNVFMINYVGYAVGALVFGWLGDRVGRRPAIILSVMFFSVPTLLSAAAGSITSLGALRFLAGAGMGGMSPTIYALLTDIAPRRYRSTFVIVALTGFSLGGALTGVAAALVIPSHGWRMLYLVCGGVGVASVIVAVAGIPESIRYLVIHRPAAARTTRLAQRLLPDRGIGPQTTLTIERPPTAGGSWRQIFAGRRAAATTWLWIMFFADTMAFVFLAMWLPVLMETAGFSPADASLTSSVYTLAGIAGGLLIMRFLDRFGPIAIVVLPIIGAPVEILIGVPGLSHATIVVLVAVVGAALVGVHFADNGVAGWFYPAAIRGQGIGAASCVGRLGSALGPFIGGFLLSAQLPLQHVLLIAATPSVVTAIAGFALGRIYTRSLARGGNERVGGPAEAKV
jgi:MFS transporter, AAHS family, 4-hydroxybenzoate transporter